MTASLMSFDKFVALLAFQEPERGTCVVRGEQIAWGERAYGHMDTISYIHRVGDPEEETTLCGEHFHGRRFFPLLPSLMLCGDCEDIWEVAERKH